MRDYLEAVREQIRWKRARPVLLRELERHMEDQRDAFLQEGKSPEEAERLAILDMGDPVTVGTELDAVHRPRPQWGLLALTIALAAIGVLLRVSFRQIDPSPDLISAKALASLALGTAAMLGMYFLDVSRLVRHARGVYIAALAGSVLAVWALAEHFSPYSSLIFTYSSYIMMLYPLAYAFWLYSFRGKGWRGLALAILGGVPLAAVCCLIPSSSSLFLLLFSGLALTLYAAGRDFFGVGRRRGICAVLAVPFGVLVYSLFKGYLSSFLNRVLIALRPELDQYGRGYMGWMLKTFWADVPPLRRVTGEASLSVNAGARVFGVSGVALRPVDFSHDFLPASMAVAWGWVPLLILLAALAALLLWMLVKGLRQSYLPGRFVVLAVALTLGLQTLFSAALNLGFLLFSAGLPLIVGNLQTVIDMALIGLALSVFRGDSIAREEPESPARPRKRLRIKVEYQ